MRDEECVELLSRKSWREERTLKIQT